MLFAFGSHVNWWIVGSISLINCVRQSFMHTRSHAHFSFVTFLPPSHFTLSAPISLSRTHFSLLFLSAPTPRLLSALGPFLDSGTITEDGNIYKIHFDFPGISDNTGYFLMWCKSDKRSLQVPIRTSYLSNFATHFQTGTCFQIGSYVFEVLF